MNYKVIKTRGFVLYTKQIAEYDRTVTFFTEDFGYIEAKAKAVRKTGAKLKGFVYPYRFATFSFIVGRDYTLKEAQAENSFSELLSEQGNKQDVYIKILRFLGRFSKAIPDKKLFKDIFDGFTALKDGNDNYEEIEIALILKILFRFGFFKDEFGSKSYEEIVEYLRNNNNKKRVLKEINDVIYKNQL